MHTLAQGNRKSTQVNTRKNYPLRKYGVCHRPRSPSVIELRSRQVTRTQALNNTSSPESGEPYEGKSKKGHQRRGKRPFKQRIYEAAIATHADPVITLAQPRGTAASRPPLHFEPLSPPPQTRGERRTTATNMARVNSLRPSSFSRPSDPDRVKFPLTHWKTHFPTNARVGGAQNVPKRNKFIEDGAKGEAAEFRPLNFVPLSQAEARYKVMFQDSVKG